MPGVKNILANKNSRTFVKFLAGAVVLFIFVFVINLFGNKIKNGFFALSYPAQKVFFIAGQSASGYVNSFLKAGSLAKENDNLKSENQKLLSQIALLQGIKEGDQAQSDVMAFCQNNGFATQMAGVIGLDSQDIVSINKGSADGILENMPVINQQNVLFGKVFKVYKNFSQVMLISNKNSVINVEVQKNIPEQTSEQVKEVNGVVKGSGGLAIYLDLIPVDDQINEQDVLITSALEEVFPKNLLVGKITKVEKNDQKPFQQAEVQPFFNIKNADNLFVITNYKR